jgi:hypothetical protein
MKLKAMTDSSEDLFTEQTHSAELQAQLTKLQTAKRNAGLMGDLDDVQMYNEKIVKLEEIHLPFSPQ